MKKDYATDFNLKYNPQTYWTGEVGKTYRERFVYGAEYIAQEQRLIEFLKTLEFRSVLEVGCGFGRITKLMLEHFPQIKTYDAADISQDQIAQACLYVADPRVTFYTSALTNMLYIASRRKYDLVLAVEVLMHVLPEDLQDNVLALSRMCRKHLVTVDWQQRSAEQQEQETDPINFSHDYATLYHQLFLDFREIQIPQSKQSIFHVELPP